MGTLCASPRLRTPSTWLGQGSTTSRCQREHGAGSSSDSYKNNHLTDNQRDIIHQPRRTTVRTTVCSSVMVQMIPVSAEKVERLQGNYSTLFHKAHEARRALGAYITPILYLLQWIFRLHVVVWLMLIEARCHVPGPKTRYPT